MKWRKVKKRIKKNIIPGLIGRLISPDNGVTWVKVTQVKVSPAGGRNVNYSITAVSPEFPPVQPLIDEVENSIGNTQVSWYSSPVDKKQRKALKDIFGV